MVNMVQSRRLSLVAGRRKWLNIAILAKGSHGQYGSI